MGIYLNPGNDKFKEDINAEIYIDKTELIAYTNSVFCSNQKYICVTRPSKFGKSMTANMLIAYYGKGTDSSKLFERFKIAQFSSFNMYLNKYNVIALNIPDFVNMACSIEKAEKEIIKELIDKYPNVDYFNQEDLTDVLLNIYAEKKEKFVFIIDDWDWIFRKLKEQVELQTQYLGYLKRLLKDKEYVALVYMTGILPIKKYGTHSSLNMFDEFSMIHPGELAKYVGLTQEEVKELCIQYKMDFNKMRLWYCGYKLKPHLHIYNPKSVIDAIKSHKCDRYWVSPEAHNILKTYLDKDYDGLKGDIIKLISGEHCPINPRSFKNDIINLSRKDDIYTLLVHFGYLNYDREQKEVYIPNQEIIDEFINISNC